MLIWKCSVCGYEFGGGAPPSECPQCSGSSREFKVKAEKKKLKFDGRKFDVLLICASSHLGHNTGLIADLAEKTLKRKKVSYRRINLSECEIHHCWCCYSMRDSACTYPCRNQLDDMPALHEMMVKSRAVIVASPINWNGMSARLKDFLDRSTCIQNRAILGKPSLTAGKTVAIMVNGHEDGAAKTFLDIFFYFQQMGYILAPFGFAYRTHGAQYDSKSDSGFFAQDEKLKRQVEGVVQNVAVMINQKMEEKLKGKIIPVCE